MTTGAKSRGTGFGVQTVASSTSRPSWSAGRILDDLAIGMVVAPIVVNSLVPPLSGPYSCGNTLENFILIAGLAYLAIRAGWIVLMFLTGAPGRDFDASMGRFDDDTHDLTSRWLQKPKPSDDF